MPYKSGMFQAALGAITAVVFLISNSFSGGSSSEKRKVGTIERLDAQRFALTEANGERQTFQLSDGAAIFLNEKSVAFEEIENGRTASVRYVRKKRVFFAMQLEVFPTHRDLS